MGLRYVLDEGSYLVLNDGQRYATHIRSRTAVEILTVFFEAGLAEEALASVSAPAEVLLDGPRGG